MLIDRETHIKNCEQLQNILNNANINNNINGLKNLLETDPSQDRRESGFRVTNSGDNYNTGNIAIAPKRNGQFPFDVGPSIVGAGHLHTKHVYPMFSFKDLPILDALWSTFANGGEPLDASKPFLLLTTLPQNNPQVYSIKIEDVTKFNTFMDGLTPEDIEKFKRKLFNKFKKINRNTNDPGPVAYQKAFLQFIKSKDIGISLYKASDDLSSWSKKQLSEDENEVNTINCQQ